ncbi:MAG: thioesterase family protein [Clostridia bacterium]|nr:thioesterase family protein [Clostridia bacterium]
MLATGMKGHLERSVTEKQTAVHMGSGELPVFATPAMVALAEETAWRSVVEGLEPGQGTVGTKMELSHLSATPIGMTVRCETELVEIDRRKLVFSIQAFDEVEKIAEGRHERFIINEESFLEKANAKGFVTPAE